MRHSSVVERVRRKSEVVRVIQLSDTHFLEDGATAEGAGSYDTGEAFDAVFDHIAGRAHADLIVVTGDIADHGHPAQYGRAAEAIGRFDQSVNVCPGNHDRDAAFTAGIGRPGIGTSRVIQTGEWCFLFVDSNAGVMIAGEHGRHLDPPDVGDRLHRNGSLGGREIEWIRDTCAATSAEHVFVWLHHPPSCPVPMVDDDDYAREWDALLREFPVIKGLGGGHTHIPDVYELLGRQVFVAPSLKHNFDIEARTWLPPGYRSYEFTPEGAVSSELHLVDDPRWPRLPLGRALMALFNGEITHDELAEIVARRQLSTESNQRPST